MHPKDKIYGQWGQSTVKIPGSNADRILGVRILHDGKGRPETVRFQWQTADGAHPFREVRMDFVNAMFLLSCLKSIQLDSGYPFPDDPRVPKPS